MSISDELKKSYITQLYRGGGGNLRDGWVQTRASTTKAVCWLDDSWCGRTDPLKLNRRVHKNVFFFVWLIAQPLSYLCVLTCEHTHARWEANGHGPWSELALWAAFNTVIEIHLLLGGGLRDFMKEKSGDGEKSEREKILTNIPTWLQIELIIFVQ